MSEIIVALVSGLLGGGAVSTLVSAVAARRKTRAEEDKLIVEASSQALDALNDSVVLPLREQIDYQEQQITHLEKIQRQSFMVVRYTRDLFHWLQDFCQVVEPDFLEEHPKPRLPDELRPVIAPETMPENEERRE